jgi:hypothetical protein
MTMTPRNQIELIYDTLQKALPATIRSQLKFLNIDRIPPKGGSKGLRGRIMGKAMGRIWDPKWCFYEIGIGS